MSNELISILIALATVGVALAGLILASNRGLRQDMAHLEAQLRGDMGQLGTELRGEMGQLGTELRGDMGQLHGGDG